MQRRPVRSGSVDQFAGPEIKEDRSRASKVSGIAVGNGKAVKQVYSPRAQIGIHKTLVIARWTGVEKPVALCGSEMDCSARAQIERIDFENGSGGPMRMLEIEMAAGNL